MRIDFSKRKKKKKFFDVKLHLFRIPRVPLFQVTIKALKAETFYRAVNKNYFLAFNVRNFQRVTFPFFFFSLNGVDT